MKKKTRHRLLLSLRAVLRYPLLGLSYLTPRQRKKWLFGCRTGFMDNPKYLFLQAVADGRRRCIWMARSRTELAEVRAAGLPAVLRSSPLGVWHCLTAGYEFFSHYANDINYWLSGRARKVMLWHGVGLKKVGNHAAATRLDRLLSPELFRPPFRFVAPSPFMAAHFGRYLEIPSERMVEAMYPRNEVFDKSPEELRRFIRRYDASLAASLDRLEPGARLFLYMPTFRETGEDFVAAAGFDFRALNALMEELGAYFLLKFHPFTRWKPEAVAGLPRIVPLEGRMDMYPLLPLVDTLVTDYSSIYYDFILLPGKRVIPFPFDYEHYLSDCRDFAYDYDAFTPGRRARSFDELLDLLRSGAATSTDDAEVKRICKLFWGTRRPLYEQLLAIS